MRLVDTTFEDSIITCSGEEVALFLTNAGAMKEIKHIQDEENSGQPTGLKPKHCKACRGYHIETPQNSGLLIPKRTTSGDRTQRGRRKWSGDGKGR